MNRIAIIVECDQTGDWAVAYGQHAAVVAARTLLEDAWDAHPVHGFQPTATFSVAGVVSRRRIPRQTIWAAIAAHNGAALREDGPCDYSELGS